MKALKLLTKESIFTHEIPIHIPGIPEEHNLLHQQALEEHNRLQQQALEEHNRLHQQALGEHNLLHQQTLNKNTPLNIQEQKEARQRIDELRKEIRKRHQEMGMDNDFDPDQIRKNIEQARQNIIAKAKKFS